MHRWHSGGAIAPTDSGAARRQAYHTGRSPCVRDVHGAAAGSGYAAAMAARWRGAVWRGERARFALRALANLPPERQAPRALVHRSRCRGVLPAPSARYSGVPGRGAACAESPQDRRAPQRELLRDHEGLYGVTLTLVTASQPSKGPGAGTSATGSSFRRRSAGSLEISGKAAGVVLRSANVSRNHGQALANPAPLRLPACRTAPGVDERLTRLQEARAPRRLSPPARGPAAFHHPPPPATRRLSPPAHTHTPPLLLHLGGGRGRAEHGLAATRDAASGDAFTWGVSAAAPGGGGGRTDSEKVCLRRRRGTPGRSLCPPAAQQAGRQSHITSNIGPSTRLCPLHR